MLDRTRPFGTVYGHNVAKYEQDGVLFDAQDNPLGKTAVVDGSIKSQKLDAAATEKLENAKLFLQNLLKDGTLSKATIFKEADSNNQDWGVIKAAMAELGIHVSTYQKAEMWKLPEKV